MTTAPTNAAAATRRIWRDLGVPDEDIVVNTETMEYAERASRFSDTGKRQETVSVSGAVPRAARGPCLHLGLGPVTAQIGDALRACR